jgi:anaerobic selenocysteine-containing dehydrogenase
MDQDSGWHATACILCSINCGIEVRLDDGRLARIRGHKEHPSSRGYLCQKAARLDYYQNHTQRLTHPQRRRPDGTFERIDWDTAIREVARRLGSIRDTHGGHAIAYYGGGGQGNHLGGAYAVPFRAALRTPYYYNSLAQEKTGDFWVNGRLFGRQTCHLTEDLEETDFALVIGTNPWQSHGFPRARKVIQAFRKDPRRKLVVIDPRRTVTAEYADLHLRVSPGKDAFLLAAMLGVIVQEGLEDRAFLERHTHGFDAVREQLSRVPVDDYAERSGIDAELVRQVARELAGARSASTRHDLGLEHSLHSTLNTYLEKLLCLITGNLAKPGGNNLHTQFVPLIGHSPEDGVRTRVTGMREISKMFPPNILPAEIDTDHPERVRAVFVDSANPLQSAADTGAYRQAFGKLDLLVVVDVAMTETARMGDYVLPAATQFEKTEATFFTLSFPSNYFHLRRPLLESAHETLPEPEIYRRLMVAMGELPERFPLLERVAAVHRKRPRARLLQKALAATFALKPRWKRFASTILYATLGRVLPEGAAAAAVVWGACQFYAARYAKQIRRAGTPGEGAMLGEALFDRLLSSDTAVAISTHAPEEMWELVAHRDRKIRLAIPEMLEELAALCDEPADLYVNGEFPFVLAAGERRSYNANQIYRDPAWRKTDREGALRIHPEDAKRIGVADGGRVRCESHRGAVEVRVQTDDAMLPGCLVLPHGFGMSYPDLDDPGVLRQNGPSINELTDAARCDPLAKTPHHKYVPVRLAPL